MTRWLPVVAIVGSIVGAWVLLQSRVSALEVSVSERRDDICQIRDDVREIRRSVDEIHAALVGSGSQARK